MADEITIYQSLQVSNGALNWARTSPQTKIDQITLGGPSPGFLTIGTSEETVGLSEISTLGWCLIENLDDTNYVDFGFSTGVYGIRVKPDEFAMFRLTPGVTLYALANTAACKVNVYVLES